MINFEKLLEPGSTDLPDCRCGEMMSLTTTAATANPVAEVKVFRCDQCHHELRLMVWASNPADQAAGSLPQRG
jgi:hypothetical protein